MQPAINRPTNFFLIFEDLGNCLSVWCKLVTVAIVRASDEQPIYAT